MPEALWAEAVELAAEVGVYAAARGIGVDYGSLKSRLQARAREARSARGGKGGSGEGFVDAGSVAELAAGLTVVEAVLPSGERVVVRGPAGAEVVATALLRELRSREH